MEILLLLLAVAAFSVGNKLGAGNGRRQTLENLNQRIAAGLGVTPEFTKKYGVRGTHLTIDCMGEDAKLGTGYNPDPYVDFVVIHSEDFKNQVGNQTRRHPKSSEVLLCDDQTCLESSRNTCKPTIFKTRRLHGT